MQVDILAVGGRGAHRARAVSSDSARPRGGIVKIRSSVILHNAWLPANAAIPSFFGQRESRGRKRKTACAPERL